MKDPFQLVGTTVADKYRVDRVLDEGGFGVVYQGYHLIVGEKVAIKCMKVLGASAGDAQRTTESFLREARALFGLTHPAIVRMYDVGALAMPLGPVPYVVLEYVDGLSLEQDLERRVLRKAPFTASELLLVFEPVMEALSFAHERGVVHRDLKPSNVMLVRAGEPTMTSKVLDFGMARTGSGAVTKGAPGFTPGYAAPEQWDPQIGPAGPACDTFAIALMLAEACTLQQVFRGEGIAQIYQATMAGARELGLGAARPDLPQELERVLLRAIRVRPDERYANARELLEAVRAAFGQTITRAPPALDVIVAPTLPATAAPLSPAALTAEPPPRAPSETPRAPSTPRATPKTSAIVRAPPPSVAPLLMGLVALVVAMGALAVVGALLLGQRRTAAARGVPPPAAAPAIEVRTSRVVGASLGPGDEDIARRVVEAHMGELRDCYAKALATKPDLKGEVGFMLDLGKSGEVASLMLGGGEPPSLDPTLTACISPRLEALRFPELKGKHFVYVVAFGT